MLRGAFGSIDGLLLAAQESEDPEMENATYNGWKSDHCINNVLVFAPDGEPLLLLVSSALLLVNLNHKKIGTIISAVLNTPGSWHDDHVAHPIFEQLRTIVPEGYFLIADTAFACGTASIEGKIRAPLKGREHVPRDLSAREHLMSVN